MIMRNWIGWAAAGLASVTAARADDAAMKAAYDQLEAIAQQDPDTQEALTDARDELRKAAAAFVERFGQDEPSGEGAFYLGMARAWSGDREAAVKGLGRYLGAGDGVVGRRKNAYFALLALLDAMNRPQEGLDVIQAHAASFKGDPEAAEMTADQQRTFEADMKRRSLLGQPAPSLTLGPVLGGEVASIEAWKGKVVLLDFFATWCPPCRRTIPWLVEMQKKSGERGLAVLGVTEIYTYAWLDGRVTRDLKRDDEIAMNEKFRTAMGIPYPVAFTPDGEGGRNYGVQGIPCLFVIDRKGVVRKFEVGAGDHTELEKLIEDLLAEK